ncbi:MAG: hypothetical protein MMC33_006346 [Icmadophila ericetorum]|nr:hypothetical protein [Icmadophila ericetorum]
MKISKDKTAANIESLSKDAENHGVETLALNHEVYEQEMGKYRHWTTEDGLTGEEKQRILVLVTGILRKERRTPTLSWPLGEEQKFHDLKLTEAPCEEMSRTSNRLWQDCQWYESQIRKRKLVDILPRPKAVELPGCSISNPASLTNPEFQSCQQLRWQTLLDVSLCETPSQTFEISRPQPLHLDRQLPPLAQILLPQPSATTYASPMRQQLPPVKQQLPSIAQLLLPWPPIATRLLSIKQELPLQTQPHQIVEQSQGSTDAEGDNYMVDINEKIINVEDAHTKDTVVGNSEEYLHHQNRLGQQRTERVRLHQPDQGQASVADTLHCQESQIDKHPPKRQKLSYDPTE